MERELTITDFLIAALKRAKNIVAWMLICSILLGAFGIFRGLSAQQKTDAALVDPVIQYRSDVATARNLLARAQEQISELTEYTDNSLYYAINAYNKGVCSLFFYVDTGYKINTDSVFQDPDKTTNVVTAYTQLYSYDEEIIGHISELLGENIDKKYIFELIDVAATGGNLVRISVTHEDANIASEIAHYIYETSEARVQQTVEKHTAQLLSDYTGYEVDADMQARHNATDLEMTEARTTLDERQKTLDELLENPVTASRSSVITEGLKFFLIGLVVGAVIGCAIAVCKQMLGDSMSSAADIAARYKLPFLGALPQDTRKRWFDGWIRRLEVDPLVPYEAAAGVIAANLTALSGDKPVLLVGTGDRAMLIKLSAVLGEHVQPAGNILTDPAAVQALAGADGVALVEVRGMAHLAQIDAEVQRLETLNKSILGIILA